MLVLLDVLLILILLFVLYDAFITIMSTQGAGPLTHAWTSNLWRLLLFMHQRKPKHRILCLAGPFMLLLSILLWYFLHALCWYLLFALQAITVISSPDKVPADWLQTLYFISSTVSSLGYGDFVPSGFPWTFYGGLIALTATIILTTSLSYILGVMRAVIERRAAAKGIFGIGGSPEEFIKNAWQIESGDSLNLHLLNLASQIEANALNRLSFPVLQYFHSSTLQQTNSRAILLLSDSLFLISQADNQDIRPPESVQHVIHNAIETYINVAPLKISSKDVNSHKSDPTLETLKELGIATVSQETFEASLQQYREQRKKLLKLCYEEGWGMG